MTGFTTPPEKLCISCKHPYPEEAFRGDFGRICQTCQSCRDRAKQSYQNRKVPNKAREYRLKNTFGISVEKYFELLECQKGLCLICDAAPERLYVDHKHGEKKVRGLLCPSCNTRVGVYESQPGRLEREIELLGRMSDYLSKNRIKRV